MFCFAAASQLLTGCKSLSWIGVLKSCVWHIYRVPRATTRPFFRHPLPPPGSLAGGAMIHQPSPQPGAYRIAQAHQPAGGVVFVRWTLCPFGGSFVNVYSAN